MNVTLSTKELSTTLKVLAMAYNKRNTLPILDNVLIEALPPDIVRLTICNLQFDDFHLRRVLHVTTPITEAEAVTVNLADLRNALPTPKAAATVILEKHGGDNQPVILRYANSNIRFDSMPANDFPPFHDDSDQSTCTVFEDLGKLRTAIEACLPAVCTDQARPILTAIHGHGTYLESADGFRLHRQEVGQAVPDFLLGAKLAKVLALSTAQKGWINSHNGRLWYADSEGWEASADSAWFGRSYPELDQVIPRASQHALTIEQKYAENWLEALSTAYKASEERILKVCLLQNKSTGLVDISTPNGNFAAAVPAKVIASYPLVIGFNSGYLRDALVCAGKVADITLELNVETTPGTIRTDQGYKAVIMPMHLNA